MMAGSSRHYSRNSGLQSLLVCFLVLSRHVLCGRYPEAFDVVTMALKPTCVNRQMITSVNQYMFPKPRHLHVVAARSCDIFERFADNVKCHPENQLVPYMTATSVTNWIVARFGPEAERAKRRSTWFFQQFLKLAVASAIPGLSEYFLIFDSDMVALRPMTWFLPLELPADSSGSSLQTLWPPLRPVHGKSEEGCVNQHPFRMLVHTGGWLPKYGYQKTYEILTGKKILHGFDNQSFVTHNMLVYKPYMADFLKAITRPKYSDLEHGWALSILDALMQIGGEIVVGFSEFWSYLSWIQERYPCAFLQAKERAWTRTPVVPQRSLNVAVPVDNGEIVRVCCPTLSHIEATRERGFFFMGYELGHLKWCNYHHPAFNSSYAEWYLAV